MHGNQRIVQTDEELALRWINGETLEQIGTDIGVTRERVRQVIKRHLDKLGVTPEAVKTMHAEDRAAARRNRERREAYQELLRRMAARRVCVMCGAFNLRADGWQTCSRECGALMTTSARYWNDDERREKHRREVARAYLRSPEKYKPSHLAWAERVLSDNPPPPNRRYVVNKNKPLAAALGAPVGRYDEQAAS